MINSTVIFARGKAIPQRGVTANYTAISAIGRATPQPGVNCIHLMKTRKVLNIMLLKQRLLPRPAKLRFDYAVRISAAEVLRKIDTNQTTGIYLQKTA